ncbi:hypothetical protein HS088_TW18G00194 [Tripterygium wilfordii]|uniref:Uncharacterized protein n=1 Tax=Tripterygium wilfordii TaxID=458696 RepID=A0A7J7CCQ4_TRIWF|nr:hypothetical protein HS088_TW18G00194 [Tripterygium wilfordii]
MQLEQHNYGCQVSITQMEKVNVLASMFFIVFLTLPMMEGAEWPPSVPQQPLCVSQVALVNYACAMLPIPPGSPPFSPTLDLQDYDHERRGSQYHGSAVEQNCCRWLNNVDAECVCAMFVRLPSFLARPAHEYTVIVHNSCNVTYTCQGGVKA